MAFPSGNGGANQGFGNFVKPSSPLFSNTPNSTGAFGVSGSGGLFSNTSNSTSAFGVSGVSGSGGLFSNTPNSTSAFGVSGSGGFGVNSTSAFGVSSVNSGGFGVNSGAPASSSPFAPAKTGNPFSLGGNTTSPFSTNPSWQSPFGVQSTSPFGTTPTVPTDQPPFRSYPTSPFVKPTNSITTTPFGTPFSSPGTSASVFVPPSNSSFNPSPFGKPFSSPANSTSVFGQTGSSSTSSFFNAPSPFGKPSSSSGNSTSVFGQTGSSSTPSFFNAPSPFGKPSSSSGNSTSVFGQTSSSSSSSFFNAPSPFGKPSSSSSGNSTFVFGQTSSSSSSVFGRNSTGSGFSDSTSPLFSSTQSSQTSPAVNSFQDFRSFVTSSTASQVQNTFSPFTSSEPGGSGFQGTKAIPYAQTRVVEDDTTRRLLSISGMPYYKSKSHEELRLEDYLGKTGAKSSSSFSIFNTSPSAPSSSIQTSVPSTGAGPGFIFVNPPNSGPSVSNTNATTAVNSFLPHSQPEMPAPLSTGLHCGNPFSRTQPITSIPNTGTNWVFSTVPASKSVNTSIQTSIPSTGAGPGFIFVNPPNSGPSVSNTNATTAVNSFLPHSQPEMPAPLSAGLHCGNPFSRTQPITSIPNTGTNWVFSTVPAFESVNTSIPEKISTGGSISGVDSSRDTINEPISQCPVSVGQYLVADPFATEPRDELPTTTIHYGISCLPVSDHAEPAKRFPPMNVKHLSHGPHRRPIEKYKPNGDGKKVPFYQELPGIYGSGSVLIPRENPRAWIVHPNEKLSLEINLSKLSVSEQSRSKSETGGTHDETTEFQEEASCAAKMNMSMNIKLDVEYPEKKNMNDIMIHADTTVLPKLRSPEYYVEPAIEDVAANERERPGFGGQVKDFVVGRHGYGSIKFLGETDVRNLNLESIVEFNMREVIVYADEKSKPPVGQGLNKPAEITLLNVKCVDKNTGKQYTDGPRVDNYRRMLMKKALENGAEFISFDPTKGEWRFRVEHF